MFAYCGNNPVKHVDLQGNEFVGAGIQIDISTGYYEFGIEIIIYWDDKVCNGEDFVVAIYVYEGVTVDIDELFKNPNVINIIQQLTLAVMSNKGIDFEQLSLVELQSLLFGTSASGSFVFIWGNGDKFTSPSDYEGGFTSWSGNIRHFKGSVAWCDSCWAVTIGGTTTDKSHISFGQTNYVQIY